MPVRRRSIAGLVVMLALVLTGACSKDDDKPGAGPAATVNEGAPVALTVVGVDGVPDDVKTAVTQTVDGYVQQAIVRPLRSGNDAGDLSAFFVAEARPQAAGADRPTLTAEGADRTPGLRAEAANLTLTGLADPSGGDAALVAARLELRLVGAAGPVFAQQGDFVLVPDGDGWRIYGYDVRATRGNGAAAAESSAASG